MAETGADRDLLLNELAEDFAARYRRGEKPALTEYVTQYPELADDIREFFPAMVEMEGAKAPATVDEIELPKFEQLGDFHILREIGHGGMGVVYEAEQISLGRRVALKLLTQRMLRDGVQKRRFEREAKAAARLHHTNIVPVFGSGEHEGTPFYVMQFIQGLGLDVVTEEVARLESGLSVAARRDISGVTRTLLTGDYLPNDSIEPSSMGSAARAVADTSSVAVSMTCPDSSGGSGDRKIRKLSYWQGVARVGVQVADALEYAHRQGIVHRDIKPSNLLLDLSGTAWVTDFGLAKGDDQDNLTNTGDVLGTMRYMPPEAFEGRTDARGDVYGLGITLYELLALRPAYDQHDRNKLIKAVTTSEPPRLRLVRRSVPRDLETIIHKAIDHEPARRYRSAGELAADLERFLKDEPIKAREISARERAWRWCRRNPMIASLLLTVVTLLIALAIGSTITAFFMRNAALVAETAQRSEATVRRQTELALSDLQTSRGLLAAERGDAAQAMLWFAAAARQNGDDPAREWSNHVRVAAWNRRVPVPVHMLIHGGRHLSSMAFSPDGRFVLCHIRDGPPVLWDLHSTQPLSWMSLDGPPGVAALSPDASRVAVGTGGVIEIRELPGGKQLERITNQGTITALAFSPDGNALAIAGNAVRIWNTRLHEFYAADRSHPASVVALAFSPRGDRLVTACSDRTARVFAVSSDDQKVEAIGSPVPHSPVFSLRDDRRIVAPIFLNNGQTLLTRSNDSELRWSETDTGKAIRSQPVQGMLSLAVSHNGKCIGAGGWINAQLFDAATGQLLLTIPHRTFVKVVAFSPTSPSFMTVSDDRKVRFVEYPSGAIGGGVLLHPEPGLLGEFSPDGKLLGLAQRDGVVRVWRMPQGDPTPVSVMTHAPAYVAARLSADGRWLINAKPDTNFGMVNVRHTHVYRVTDGQPVGPELELDPGDELKDAALSHDGITAVTVSSRLGSGHPAQGGRCALWDPQTGQRTGSIELTSEPGRVVYRYDGAVVAVICYNGDVFVIDVARGEVTNRLRHELKQTPERCYARFTNDGQGLVTAAGTTVRVWDLASNRLRYPPLEHGSPLYQLAISHDGQFLATSAVDGLRVWDLNTGQLASPIMAHPDWVFQPAFSPDNCHVAIACRDGTARVWDWRAGRMVCPPMKHDDEVFGVEFSPDGRMLNTVTWRAGLRVWDWHTGRPLTPAIRPWNTDWAYNLQLTPAGDRVIVSSTSQFHVFRMSDLIRSDSLNNSDVSMLAELSAGRRIDQGEVVDLTAEEWIARWQAANQGESLLKRLRLE